MTPPPMTDATQEPEFLPELRERARDGRALPINTRKQVCELMDYLDTLRAERDAAVAKVEAQKTKILICECGWPRTKGYCENVSGCEYALDVPSTQAPAAGEVR